jgi:modulator of FtsH protease
MARLQTTTHGKIRSRSIVAEHEVLRNTYCLLGLSLIVCAICAVISVITRAHPGPLLTIAGMYGLLFCVNSNADNGYGILFTFLFTGFMGYTLGPILNMVLHGYANGTAILITTTACTGTIFLALSAYVLTTRQDFSYLGGMLFIMLFGGIALSLLNLWLGLPMLYMGISSLFVLVFSGLIMYHTSEIIHGGERNYIIATVSLFMTIYNLFISLLRIFMMFSDRRD